MSPSRGVTAMPLASISSRPAPAMRPMAARRPSCTARSDSRGSRPVPSITVPLRTPRSNSAAMALSCDLLARSLGGSGRFVRVDGAHDITVCRRLVELPQETQFDQRPGIEVDAQVDEGEAFAVHHEESARLHLFPLTPTAVPR